MDALTDLLEESPESMASFIASPVKLHENQIYPIENYGSAMAPFYSTLAICWCGCNGGYAESYCVRECEEETKESKGTSALFWTNDPDGLPRYSAECTDLSGRFVFLGYSV